MKKFFICTLIVVCLCAGTASAEFGSTDSNNLATIKNSLTQNVTGSVFGKLNDIYDKLFYIEQSTDFLQNMNNQLNHTADILGYGDSVSAYPSIYSLIYHSNELLYDIGGALTSTGSSSINALLTAIKGTSQTTATYQSMLFNAVSVELFKYDANGNIVSAGTLKNNIPGYISMLYANLAKDTVNQYSGDKSLYGLVKQMQMVLASDEDLALAQAQKENRIEIEESFLSGSSGSTSLGASDFGDLSDVGGTVNETLSLNGQASISSFTSGLADADQEGQNWFSSSTRDSLDSVSSSVSTYSLGDPYNMFGWEDNYSWVLGGE